MEGDWIWFNLLEIQYSTVIANLIVDASLNQEI